MTGDEIVKEIGGNCRWLRYRVRQLVWMGTAAFCGFATKNLPKIRKKLKRAVDSEDQGDVLAELEYAARVVADSRFAADYEPYDSDDGRGPDFLVFASGVQDFHLEVKRIREAATMVALRREVPDGGERGFWEIPYTHKEWLKFGDRILDGMGQLRPGRANVLGIKIESCTHDPEDLIPALRGLGGRVMARDDEFFRRKAKGWCAGAMDFYVKFSLVSGIVVTTMWRSVAAEKASNMVWLNPRAAVPLEPDVAAHLRSM